MTVVTFANPDALFTSKHDAEHRHMSENALAQERWRGDGPRYASAVRAPVPKTRPYSARSSAARTIPAMSIRVFMRPS